MLIAAYLSPQRAQTTMTQLARHSTATQSAGPSSCLTDRGALQLDLRPLYDVRMRLQPWRNGCVVERWEDGQWQPEPMDPGLKLLPSTEVAEPLRPELVAQYLEPVPGEVKAAVERYQSFQVGLLGLSARHDKAFIDILTSAPNLAWLIAGVQQDSQLNEAEVATLLAGRRRKILKTLMGAGSDATLRFIDKLDLIKGDAAEFHLVRCALRQPEWQERLRHWPRIPVEALYLLRRRPSLLNARLLEQAQTPPAPRRITALSELFRDLLADWEDTLELGHALGIGEARQRVDACACAEELRVLHDRWTERLNQRPIPSSDSHERNIPFPPPPLAGTDTIVPVPDRRALKAEGARMHHCVASYERRVHAGETYIYRVLEPERATLALAHRYGQWTVTELKRSYNREVSEETRQAVERWFATAERS